MKLRFAWRIIQFFEIFSGYDWENDEAIHDKRKSEKCEQVQPWTQNTVLVLTNTSPASNYLRKAYVGRVVVTNNLTVNVLVDDRPFQTGTNILVGNTCRTWYDEVSYA